jgi:hypothetical protein
MAKRRRRKASIHRYRKPHGAKFGDIATHALQFILALIATSIIFGIGNWVLAELWHARHPLTSDVGILPIETTPSVHTPYMPGSGHMAWHALLQAICEF